jgi:hypothetical protein
MRWGKSGKSHAETIMQFAKEIGAETALDYGSGQGTLKDAISLPVQEYDPGIPGKDVLPKPADLIVCTDVLEHIEPDKVDNVLRHLRSLSRKGLFAVIALTPAKQILSDGRNAHLSLYSAPWWTDRVSRAGFVVTKKNFRKGFWIWAVPTNKIKAKVHYLLHHARDRR